MHEKSFKRGKLDSDLSVLCRTTTLLLSGVFFGELLTSFDPKTEEMKVCQESNYKLIHYILALHIKYSKLM